MSFALGVIPVVLLLLGFPIFLVLLTGVTVALVWYMKVPLAALHHTLYGSIDAFALRTGDRVQRLRRPGLGVVVRRSVFDHMLFRESVARGAVAFDACGVTDVLDKKCRSCHEKKPAFGAPMALVTREDLLAPLPSDPSKRVLDGVLESGQVTPDEMPAVVGRISFFVNAGIRFVEEMCKLRAMGRLWDRIVQERYGVTREEAEKQVEKWQSGWKKDWFN